MPFCKLTVGINAENYILIL